MNDYGDYTINELLEGVRECCRCFSCPDCPLSAYGARKCPVPVIQQTCAVIFDKEY